jgi:hypothetical protein
MNRRTPKSAKLELKANAAPLTKCTLVHQLSRSSLYVIVPRSMYKMAAVVWLAALGFWPPKHFRNLDSRIIESLLTSYPN